MTFDDAFDLGLCNDCDQDPICCHMAGKCVYDELDEEDDNYDE